MNRLGDLVCPHCHTNHITPMYALVQRGWGRCSRCTRRFRVSGGAAKAANERAAMLMAGALPPRVEPSV